jgi:hypothetical protein
MNAGLNTKGTKYTGGTKNSVDHVPEARATGSGVAFGLRKLPHR